MIVGSASRFEAKPRPSSRIYACLGLSVWLCAREEPCGPCQKTYSVCLRLKEGLILPVGARTRYQLRRVAGRSRPGAPIRCLLLGSNRLSSVQFRGVGLHTDGNGYACRVRRRSGAFTSLNRRFRAPAIASLRLDLTLVARGFGAPRCATGMYWCLLCS